MTSSEQHRNWILGICPRASVFALALATIFVLSIVATQSAQAQIFTPLHVFSGHDGQEPMAGLTMDRAGNLYGTTTYGGSAGLGTVFKLTRKNSNWVFTPLYSFQGGTDGAFPGSGVLIGPDGTLYGTTAQGGSSGCNSQGCGTVYSLRPRATACETALCPWTETVLYRFPDPSNGSGDGADPVGELTFDVAGNLYGVTAAGGSSCCNGVVYKLSPSNGSWTESVIFSFQTSGGIVPAGGVVFDGLGNLYGTTNQGGDFGFGTIYQLTPSGSGWVENVLHSFQNASDGSYSADLIFDSSGNLYGATYDGGPNGGGTVYQLTPSNGTWTFNLLYGFFGDGAGGQLGGRLALDAAGNLYGGTIYGGDSNAGTVFKLTPSGSSWSHTTLHSFVPNGSGGEFPNGSLALDTNGNVFGTTQVGGSGNPAEGVVFEIVPAVYYTTNFPLTENPISEDGNWTNGGCCGNSSLWGNIQTTPGEVFGVSEPTTYGDPTAIVNGTWGSNQTITVTVKITSQPTSCCHELELRPLTTISTNSITGYEINCSTVTGDPYIQLVRWNGTNGNYTQLDQLVPAQPCKNGDVLVGTTTVSGGTVTFGLTVNGVQQVFTNCHCTNPSDSGAGAFLTGSPGIGFYDNQDSNWSYFGFSNFTATAE